MYNFHFLEIKIPYVIKSEIFQLYIVFCGKSAEMVSFDDRRRN